MTWSTRAELVYARTYSRPKDDGTYETWPETVERVVGHQEWLWHHAKRNRLNERERGELEELHNLLSERRALVAGRTLWLGGTDLSKRRQSSQFNCSFLEVRNAYDAVDALWLLLQGCGVGFSPVAGALNGFARPLQVEVVRSSRSDRGGTESTTDSFDPESRRWTITIGDSAEAWAKSIGVLLARKFAAERLVLDFSNLRPAGERLKGYGWISQGDEAISKAYIAICSILNRRAGQLLTRIDILDIINHLGTMLSTRRSAEIALVPWGDPEWQDFAQAKNNYWLEGNSQRAQSNNSLVFHSKPSKSELEYIFDLMATSGGSEPGIINGAASLRRAPYWRGTNPCAEILLPNQGFCNLVTVDVARFRDNWAGLLRAQQVMARANYRQTCVDLDDGILQGSWHENNEFFRLCGASLTGLVRRPDLLNTYSLRQLRNAATVGSHSMAMDLGLPIPKNTTTIKPEGTSSKLMETTEGIHKPLGRYIFNNIQFSKWDPLVEKLQAANYRTIDHPLDSTGVVVAFPVEWSDIAFTIVNGVPINIESALEQLNRYKLLMDNYVDHNVSNTISYSKEEIPSVVEWLDRNWDSYVGVSFLPRLDPTLKAEDLGFPYLPQVVVDKKAFLEYTDTLKSVEIAGGDPLVDEACTTGACPIR